jgi:hypothetical protein
MPGWTLGRRKREKQAACFRLYHWETAEDEGDDDDDEEDGRGSKERQFRPTTGKRPRMKGGDERAHLFLGLGRTTGQQVSAYGVNPGLGYLGPSGRAPAFV